LVGVFLCVLALAGTVLFLSGLATQAYWAMAIPVAVLVVLFMALVFWVGWTFIMTESGPEQLPLRPTRPTQRQR
jgi:hypothetical protein